MPASDGLVTRLDTVPYNNFTHIMVTAAEYGYDLTPFLDEALHTPDLNAGESDNLTGERYYVFLERVLANIDIPAFGVRVGQKFSLVDYGVLGYACISCPTLRQYLKTFFRFQSLVGSSASFSESFHEEDGNALIKIHSSRISDQLYRFDIEEAMGQWIVGAEIMWKGRGSMFTRINLSFPEPEYAKEMQVLLACPVFYNQPCNELIFPAELLAHPTEMANDLTAQLCEQQCDTILRNLTQQRGLVQQIRKLIIKQPGRVPTPENIAGQLNVSYRTLRRRLSSEGTSFMEIRNELRKGLAGEYMRQTDLSTQEIAFLLGYSEASNFHRAFKQWYETTPREYRLATGLEL